MLAKALNVGNNILATQADLKTTIAERKADLFKWMLTIGAAYSGVIIGHHQANLTASDTILIVSASNL